jgi:hypothetical protein
MDTEHVFKESAWLVRLARLGSTTKQKHVTSTTPNIRATDATTEIFGGRVVTIVQLTILLSDLICVAMPSARPHGCASAAMARLSAPATLISGSARCTAPSQPSPCCELHLLGVEQGNWLAARLLEGTVHRSSACVVVFRMQLSPVGQPRQFRHWPRSLLCRTSHAGSLEEARRFICTSSQPGLAPATNNSTSGQMLTFPKSHHQFAVSIVDIAGASIGPRIV